MLEAMGLQQRGKSVRNSICTCLVFCHFFGAASAKPNFGCYAQTYSAVHLEAHPEQVVASMSLKLSRADGTEGVNALAGSVIAALTVVLANQGHVGRNSFPVEEFPNGFGGETMYQVFLCDAGGKICGEACMASVNEGNKFDVLSNDGETLIIRLSSLVVGQGQDCGGYTDIASLPGRPIDFVLARVEDSICKDSLEK